MYYTLQVFMKNVKDNVLRKKNLTEIQGTLMSNNFPWYYAKSQKRNDNDSSYLTHSFFHDKKINSDFFNILKPILNIMNPTTLINIRANLILNRRGNFSKYHIDIENFKNTTAIFYVNTNNGCTQFKKDNKKIKCVENRLLTFDSTLYHKAISQTDTDTRIVINFNYL